MKKIYYFLMAAFLSPTIMFAQPANDTCSGAIPIEIDGPALTADNTDATITGDIASCYLGQTAGDVWYTFTITEVTTLTVSTAAGSVDDTRLTLFSIEDCGGDDETYTEIACNDDVDLFADNYLSSLTAVNLEPGTYYIKAGTYNASAVGTFEVFVVTATQAENDSCEEATELEVDGPAAIADNTAALIDGPEGSCYGATQVSGDTWFTFTTTEVMNIQILSEILEGYEGTMDSQLSVWTIDGCGTEEEEYTEIGCNEDPSGDVFMAAVLLIDLAPGTYYVKAGTYSDFIVGAFNVSVNNIGEIPANSECVDAEIQDLIIDGETVSVTGSGTNSFDVSGIGYPHVWEAFTITECADVTIDYCGTPIVTGTFFTEIINGCPIGEESTLIAATSSESAGCDDGNAILTYDDLPAGTYYYPVLSIVGTTVLDDYTVNFTAVACDGTSGISEVDNANFSIFPNPNNGQFSIRNAGLTGDYIVEMIDLSGRTIHTQASVLNANSVTEVSTDKVAPGVYMIRMTNTKDNSFVTKRIVVQ